MMKREEVNNQNQDIIGRIVSVHNQYKKCNLLIKLLEY